MPFFDLDFDLQIFEIEVFDAPDFGEADPSDSEDTTEDTTDILTFEPSETPRGKIAWGDQYTDAFVFVTSAAGSGNTTAGYGQQAPGPDVFGSSSATSTSTASAVG